MLRMKFFRTADSGEDRPRRTISDKVDVAWGDRQEDNERESPRIEARLVASVEVEAGTYVGFVENLSESGVFVATQARQKVGAVVHLLIALPDLALVRVDGTVRWLRSPSKNDGQSPGMGIRFERLSVLDAVRIHEFAKSRQSGIFGEADRTNLRTA